MARTVKDPVGKRKAQKATRPTRKDKLPPKQPKAKRPPKPRLGLSVEELTQRFVIPETHSHLVVPTPTEADLNALISSLRERLRVLYSSMILEFIQKQSPKDRQNFADARDDLQNKVDKLEQAQLQDIADDLQNNNVKIKAGINNLKRESEKLESTAKIIGYIMEVAAVVARIVALAA